MTERDRRELKMAGLLHDCGKVTTPVHVVDKGYPKGLRREQMSVQSRCIGIADIFEALTAVDRPHKKGKTLSESRAILGQFKLNGHIDPDLFDVFIWEKVYLKYAEQYLDPSQIDAVDLSKIPGYVPPSI